ncbi:hypothetical protein ACTXGU_00115 [Niallia sp. 01092]|uniref:hypothetical protein n=1 Tax=Niallia sp. 01092 TaxID=3457759 RepID=UPI003FD3A09E
MGKNLIPFDKIDQLLTDIKDITSGTEDIVSSISKEIPIVRMLEVTKHIWNHHKERKMKKFLIGLSKKISEHEGYEISDRIELRKFLSDDFTRDKFFNILDEALNTNSELSSEILGFYAGVILLSSENLNYKHTVIINALRNMNDWDIKNFQKAYSFFITMPINQPLNSVCLYHRVSIEQLEEQQSLEDSIYNDEFNEFKSTLIKLSNLQILTLSQILMSDDPTTFMRTKIADELYNLIKVFQLEK